MNTNYKETLDDIFKYNGVAGVIQYFMQHEKLDKDLAEQKALDLGFYSTISLEEIKKDIEVIDDETLAEFSSELQSTPEIERVGFIQKFLGNLKQLIRSDAKVMSRDESVEMLGEDTVKEIESLVLTPDEAKDLPPELPVEETPPTVEQSENESEVVPDNR